MDKHLESLLKKLYERFETEARFSVSAPEYQKEEIDALVEMGLISRINATAFAGWIYELSPTYEGRTYFQKTRAEKRQRWWRFAFEWIKLLFRLLITSVR